MLLRAIGCIDNQTYTDWEHIIQIDDPEKAVEIPDHPNRKIYRCPEWHENHTGNTCRGLAFDKAEGEWILYLDDDDLLYPNCLEVVARHIERQPELDWGYFCIDRLGFPFFNYPPEGGRMTGGQIFHRKYINNVPIRWAEGVNYCGDWELIARCLLGKEPILIADTLGELPEYHHGWDY